MSHVDFNKPYVVWLIFFLSLSYVDFKKWPCRRAEFIDQEPQYCEMCSPQ